MTLTRRRIFGTTGAVAAQAEPAPPSPSGRQVQYVNVKAHGAVGDGVADDTDALRAAIDTTLGHQPSIRGGKIFFPKGAYRITDTLTITQASVNVEGMGWSGAKGVDAESRGSVIVWDGRPDIPMMRLDYCWGTKISRLRFVGRASSRPSAAISLRNLESHPSGSNFNQLSSLWIGSMEGYEAAEKQFAAGIVVEGDNVNGDLNRFETMVISGCDVGVNITQQQFVRNHFSMLRIERCGTAFRTNATISTSGDNWVFSDSATNDLDLGLGARLRVDGFWSRGSKRLVVGKASCLTIKDGAWHMGPNMAPDGLLVDGRGGSGRAFVRLQDFDFAGRAAVRGRIHWEPPDQVLLSNVSGI